MPHSQRPASPETLSGISSSASSRVLSALRATRSRAFRGFTLVELIVVVTILAILATVGFLALSGYTSDAGRSAVLSDLRTVEKGLSVTAATSGSFPAPTGGVPVTYSGWTAWVQWTAGTSVAAAIGMGEPPKDPAGNAEFEYSVTANGLEFQVGSAYLAGTAHAPAPGIPSALAADSVPVPKAAVSGNYNGLFVPVNAGGTNFLVPAPSIILSDLSVPELKSAPASGPSFVADGLPGTPASWSGKVAGLSQTGIAFPAAKTAAYSSATEAFPATSTGVAALAETLAQAYSGTSLAALPKVSAVVKASAAGDSSGLASAVAGAGVSSLGRNLAPADSGTSGGSSEENPGAAAVSSDPYWNSVSLLLHGDGADGANNGTFVDSSSSRLAIVRNGDVTQGSFSPFAGQGGGGYFDGNGDWLTLPTTSTGLNIASGEDFTAELFFYRTGDDHWGGGQGASILNGANGISTPIIDISEASSSNFYVRFAITNPGNYVSVPKVTTHAWHHLAASRRDGTVRLFLDGKQIYSYTDSGSFTFSNALVGRHGTLWRWWQGYLSNFRIVAWSALYVSDFPPPTSTLSDVSGTKLLLKFENAGIVDSARKNAITSYGDAKIATWSGKFSEAIVFNATNSRLTLADSADWNFWSGDFTAEFWMKTTAVSQQDIVGQWVNGGGTNRNFDCMVNTSWYAGKIECSLNVSWTNYSLRTTSSVNDGGWHHIAFVRNGTALSLYKDGVREATNVSVTGTANDSTDVLEIGSYDNGYFFNGLLDDLRITKAARYAEGTGDNAGKMVHAGTNTPALPNEAFPNQ